MRGKRKWIIFLIFTIVLMNVPFAQASVILNEVFADPPSGLIGDANNDGTRSATQDEFVELLNFGTEEVDISGWSISDSVSTRHIFPSSTVLSPYTFLAVFGGGNPVLPDINWQVASSGSLGLNNGGDTVSLFNSDTQLIDQVIYGSIGNHNQSITLFPDGQGLEFFLHSDLEQAQGNLFSPGTSIDSRLTLAFDNDENGEEEQEDPIDNATVPELPTLLYFALGWGSIFFRQKWHYNVLTL